MNVPRECTEYVLNCLRLIPAAAARVPANDFLTSTTEVSK